jgi:hypothetical protein
VIETAGGGSDLYSEYLGEGIQAVLMETEPAIATTASIKYTNLLLFIPLITELSQIYQRILNTISHLSNHHQ